MNPLMPLGCRGSDAGQDTPAAAPAASPTTAKVALPAVPPLVVALDPPVLTGKFRWEPETVGIHTLLVEVGLMELNGVIAVVAERPLSPGLSHPVGMAEAQNWTASLRIGDDPSALEVELELCTPGRRKCRSTAATATQEEPQLATAKLLAFAAEVLEREPAARAVSQWSMPVSQDPYAVLMCGRAASAWYGLLESSASNDEDKSKDPIVRAVLIDPSMALAQWLLARRYALDLRWDDAMPHFAAAREGRPLAPVILADEAVTMENVRLGAAAAEAWDALLSAVPRDPRFQLASVETDLRIMQLDSARAELEQLVLDWPKDSGVAASRVTLADKAGEEKGVDELLEHWAQTDTTAVEPVRRRVQLRIRQNAFPEATAMLPELRARGADSLADDYEVPLGVALGDFETAAKAAERMQRPDVAARIRAREGLMAHPPRAPKLGDRIGPDGYLALGWFALQQGRPKDALTYADAADKLRPWDPDILTLSRDALSLLGNASAAQKVSDRMRLTEPPSPAVRLAAAE